MKLSSTYGIKEAFHFVICCTIGNRFDHNLIQNTWSDAAISGIGSTRRLDFQKTPSVNLEPNGITKLLPVKKSVVEC